MDSYTTGGAVMRYYKITNDVGELMLIGTGLGGTEITEEEYNTLSDEIKSMDWTQETTTF